MIDLILNVLLFFGHVDYRPGFEAEVLSKGFQICSASAETLRMSDPELVDASFRFLCGGVG